jgi:hypothetical protein
MVIGPFQLLAPAAASAERTVVPAVGSTSVVPTGVDTPAFKVTRVPPPAPAVVLMTVTSGVFPRALLLATTSPPKDGPLIVVAPE